MVEKTVNVEVKTSLQLPSRTQEMDFKYPQGEQPVKSNEFSKAKEKNKSSHIFFAN